MSERRYLSTTVASQCADRRRVSTASIGRREVDPKSQYNRRRTDDDDEDGYSRHDKVTILSRVNGDSYHTNSSRIVKFKSSYHGDDQFPKSRTRKICLEQLDGECSYRNDQSKNNFGQRSFIERNYSRSPYGNFRNSSWVLQESKTGWYAIYVHNVEECDEVIKVIQHHIVPIQFYPYRVHFNESTIIFYIDDFKTARILQNLNCRLKLADNRKLTIRVRHYWPLRPTLPLRSEEKEKMAQAIANRYNPNTKCMNLSYFHSCLLFTENKLFLPLNRPAVLLAALQIAAEYVKNDLYGLSLEKNFIFSGEGLKWIRRLFPELKVLDLSDNKLTDLKELKSLSGFNIEELNLLKNPVNCREDKEYYNREVQEMFPMLKKFGKTEFQFRYCIFTDFKFKMPVNRESNYPVPERLDPNEPNSVTEFVQKFISLYFDLYDNKVSRQRIGVMYHDNSIFTLSSIKLLENARGNLLDYSQESRNLLHSSRIKNENRFLHKGQENIVNFLEMLPKTKHDLGSFLIDVPIANSALTQIIVNGVFAENFEEGDRRHEFKSFCRTFCLICNGNVWRILSDMLFVTIATDEIIIESVKRFNALKQLNKNNFNIHGPNKIMFMEDAVLSSSNHRPFMQKYPPPSYQEAMSSVSVDSQPSSFHHSVSIHQNQQNISQNHVTQPAAMTFTPPETMTSTFPETIVLTPPAIMNLTPPATMTLTSPSTMMLTPPATKFLTSPAAMTVKMKQEPNSMSMSVLNMTPSSSSTSLCSSIPMSSSSTIVPSSKTYRKPDNLFLIKKFSIETGMNDEWAKKCLEENNWDYSSATKSFLNLKPSIPSIAYIHYIS